MTIIDELMKYDAGDFVLPEKDFKMALSKVGGKEFTFPLKALDPELAAEIKESSFSMVYRNKTTKMEPNLYQGTVRKVVEGCPTVFKSEQLQAKFKANSAFELVKKLLTPGEIDTLSDEIDKLCGYDIEDSVNKVKN